MIISLDRLSAIRRRIDRRIIPQLPITFADGLLIVVPPRRSSTMPRCVIA
ncbi:MAG: hypothetical protein QM766_16625 [Burkholderiaceae bacterium]